MNEKKKNLWENSTVNGRANLPIRINKTDGLKIDYLFNANDQRISKHTTNQAESKNLVNDAEYYLTDVGRKTLAILDENKGKWDYYIFGRERFAKLQPDSLQAHEFIEGDIANNDDVNDEIKEKTEYL